jgi:hypothetical protein
VANLKTKRDQRFAGSGGGAISNGGSGAEKQKRRYRSRTHLEKNPKDMYFTCLEPGEHVISPQVVQTRQGQLQG